MSGTDDYLIWIYILTYERKTENFYQKDQDKEKLHFSKGYHCKFHKINSTLSMITPTKTFIEHKNVNFNLWILLLMQQSNITRKIKLLSNLQSTPLYTSGSLCMSSSCSSIFVSIWYCLSFNFSHFDGYVGCWTVAWILISLMTNLLYWLYELFTYSEYIHIHIYHIYLQVLWLAFSFCLF